MTTPHPAQPLVVGIIGASRMGSYHAETIASRLGEGRPGHRAVRLVRRHL
jgi:hypothetical protein